MRHRLVLDSDDRSTSSSRTYVVLSVRLLCLKDTWSKILAEEGLRHVHFH